MMAAAASHVRLKRGDTSRALVVKLRLGGVPINLAGATVALLWKRSDGTVARLIAAVTDVAGGEAQYLPQPADVATDGVFLLEWEITFPGGAMLTAPTRGYVRLTIEPDLG